MTHKHATHLLDEAPMLVYPTLARILGINGAVMLQQLHFLLNSTKTAKNKYNFINSRWWVYNSYAEWQRDHFSWLSVSGIKYQFLALEDEGIVLSMQGVKNPSDRRKWYSIDYEFWEHYVAKFSHNLADASDKNNPTIGQNLSHGSSDKNEPMVGQNLSDDSSETPSQTPPETEETETTTTAALIAPVVVVVDETDQRVWDAAFHQLEMQLDRASFETWLRGAVLRQVEREASAPGVPNGTLGVTTFVVGVRNSFARDMLQHRLYRNVRRVLSDVAGVPLELRFEIHELPAQADDNEAMPLFRLLAQQDPASPVAPLHAQDDTLTIRACFEQYVGAVTEQTRTTLEFLETHYDAATVGYAFTVMAGAQAQGRVRDPLSYTLGILRKLEVRA
ncbi:MAG: hypothetical protein U0521_28595 [Anaerolineae bacterium]